MSKLVSIIIPTFQRYKDLEELSDSLLNINTYRDIQVIIIDNNSQGIDYAKIISKFKDQNILVHFLVNYEQGALSRSRNMGRNAAKGEFLFFIDDDNVLKKDTIKKLVDIFNLDAKIGIVSPVAFYYGCKNKVLDGGARRNYFNSFTVNLFLNEDANCLPKGIFEVSEISNAFMVRNSVFSRIGLFDDVNFPIDLDEADFCLRARRAGFKIFAAEEANIYHKVEKINSLAITSLRFRREKNAYYMGRNRILFQRKHLSQISYLFYLIVYFPVFCYLYLFSLLLPQQGGNLRLRFKFMGKFMEGITDGLFYDKKKLKVTYG